MFFYEAFLIISQQSTAYNFRLKVIHAGMMLGSYRKGGGIPCKKPAREDNTAQDWTLLIIPLPFLYNLLTFQLDSSVL
jgi:hypothetical protein